MFVLCACGCGKKILAFDERDRRPRKYSKGHNRRRVKPHNYKNGRVKHGLGWVNIHVPDHPHAYGGGYVPEHRIIMEKHLGRYLWSFEDVHHINGIKDDNRIENLQVMTRSEHMRLERRNKIIQTA